jgi:hypothetical protein
MGTGQLKRAFEGAMGSFIAKPESTQDMLGNMRKRKPTTEEVATAAWYIYKLFNNTVRLLYEHPLPVLERTNRQSPITYISIVDPIHVTNVFQYKQLLLTLRLHDAGVAGKGSLLREQCRLAVDLLKSRGEAVPPLGNEQALHSLLSACIPANPLVKFFCARSYDCDAASFPEENDGPALKERREATLRRAKDGVRNEYLVVGLSDIPGYSGSLLRTMRVLGRLLPTFFGGLADDPAFKISIQDHEQGVRKLFESEASGVPPEARKFLARRSSYDAELYMFLRGRFAEQEESCRNN